MATVADGAALLRVVTRVDYSSAASALRTEYLSPAGLDDHVRGLIADARRYRIHANVRADGRPFACVGHSPALHLGMPGGGQDA